MILIRKTEKSTFNIGDDSVTPITRTRHSDERENFNQDFESNHHWLSEFHHVLQFCYLCEMGKIKPIIYTIPHSCDITEWQTSVESKYLLKDSSHILICLTP